MIAIILLSALVTTACSKKDHKVSNPVAVELYQVSITAFPENNPQGGTWDSEIIFSDPFGRPDLHFAILDNNWDTIGSTSGYTRLNANHGNLPLSFSVEPAATVSLDKTISLYVADDDDFDASDYMGTITLDTLLRFKNEQPDYLTVSSGNVAARLYIKWK
ncbi:MAG: hypothetical protein U0V74_01125 [Chitinophagales bacterium]